MLGTFLTVIILEEEEEKKKKMEKEGKIIETEESDGFNMPFNEEEENELIKKINKRGEDKQYDVTILSESFGEGMHAIIKKCLFKGKKCALKQIKAQIPSRTHLPKMRERQFMSEIVYWLSVQNGEFIDPEDFEEYLTLTHQQRLLQSKIPIGIIPLYHVYFENVSTEEGKAIYNINFVMPLLDGSCIEFNKGTKQVNVNVNPNEIARRWMDYPIYKDLPSDRNERSKYIDLCSFYCFAGLDRIHNNGRYHPNQKSFIHGDLSERNILYKVVGEKINLDTVAFFLADFGLATGIDKDEMYVIEPFSNLGLYNAAMRPAFLTDMERVTPDQDFPFTKFVTEKKRYQLKILKNQTEESKKTLIEGQKKYGITNIMDFTPMARFMVFLNIDSSLYYFKNNQIASLLKLNEIPITQNSPDLYRLRYLLFVFASNFGQNDNVITNQENLVSFYNDFCDLYKSDSAIWMNNMKKEKSLYIRYIYFLILPFDLRPQMSEVINLVNN